MSTQCIIQSRVKRCKKLHFVDINTAEVRLCAPSICDFLRLYFMGIMHCTTCRYSEGKICSSRGAFPKSTKGVKRRNVAFLTVIGSLFDLCGRKLPKWKHALRLRLQSPLLINFSIIYTKAQKIRVTGVIEAIFLCACEQWLLFLDTRSMQNISSLCLHGVSLWITSLRAAEPPSVRCLLLSEEESPQKSNKREKDSAERVLDNIPSDKT